MIMKGKPFTLEELRVLTEPRTWFRKSLTERPKSEFDGNPQLGLRLDVLVEEAQVLDYRLRQGEIFLPDYQAELQRVRRDIGNILYL